MGFQIIPAIDLRAGRCVRLAQGDFNRETGWSDDPAEVARRWTEAGAAVIHVVDLDGAAAGISANLEGLREIRSATGVTLQFGGGLRSDAAVGAAFSAGADRVVLGTALVSRPEWVAELCERYGDRVVAGIDARHGRVAIQGWVEASALRIEEVAERANRMGVRRALVTDVERDGMLQGPSLETLTAVVSRATFEVQASGGITSVDDLRAVRNAGAAAAIVGQALYTGRIDLAEAIAALLVPSPLAGEGWGEGRL